jgi:pimeloyl-ACP methyl ester carboxylesterase
MQGGASCSASISRRRDTHHKRAVVVAPNASLRGIRPDQYLYTHRSQSAVERTSNVRHLGAQIRRIGSCPGPSLRSVFSRSSTRTSLLPYWRYRHDPGAALPAGSPPEVPTAISLFGGERIQFPKPPRELAERYFRVSDWHVEPTGGHFPAVAAPALLAAILRDAFRPYR